MNLFSKFSSGSLSAAWKYSTENVLWRIMFSEYGLIIGEDRNTETKTVTFFCLDGPSGHPVWKNKTYGEQWWTGLDAVKEDRLYLHEFRKPDMPEHKNIIAVNLRTGEMVWKNTDCTFIAIQSPYIYGYKDLFERRVYYRIDSKTGAMLEEISALPEGLDPNLRYEKTDFLFPRTFVDDGSATSKFINETEGKVSTEIIEHNNFAIVNIYSRNTPPAEGLKNTLSIIDSTTKKKVYSDVLNESTPYPVPDSFFVDGDRVYYIKERKTFVAVDLRRK